MKKNRPLLFFFLVAFFLSCQGESSIVKIVRKSAHSNHLQLKEDNTLSQTLIFGGQKSSQGIAEHIVKLQSWGGCTGSFLKFDQSNEKNYIISSAHCVVEPKMEIRFPNSQNQGLSGSSCHLTQSNILFFPEWPIPYGNIIKQKTFKDKNGNSLNITNSRTVTEKLMPNDFALFHLPSHCVVPSWMKPLPVIQNTNDLRKTNLFAYVSGFGRTGPEQAHSNHSKSIKVPQNQINLSYLPKLIYVQTGSSASCSGDSGGSLIVEQEGQQAIAGNLWGGDGCRGNKENAESAFTNILNALPWIEQTVGKRVSRWQSGPSTASNGTCLGLFSFQENIGIYQFPTTQGKVKTIKATGDLAFLKNSILIPYFALKIFMRSFLALGQR